jgi:hypothetical protein
MIATEEQNRLDVLAAKIRGLPVQDAFRRKRQLYTNATAAAQKCLQDLNDALQQVRALRTIRGESELLVDSESKRRSSARLRAEELKRLLEGNEIDQGKVSEKFDSLKRSTTSLLTDVRTDWTQLCNSHAERASLFKALAQQIDVAVALRIEALSRRLRADSAVPTAAEDVSAALQVRADLAAEIEKLNTTGPVETFLRDAIVGRGDPKALLNADVRDYLDAHPSLWQTLRVVLQ